MWAAIVCACCISTLSQAPVSMAALENHVESVSTNRLIENQSAETADTASHSWSPWEGRPSPLTAPATTACLVCWCQLMATSQPLRRLHPVHAHSQIILLLFPLLTVKRYPNKTECQKVNETVKWLQDQWILTEHSRSHKAVYYNIYHHLSRWASVSANNPFLEFTSQTFQLFISVLLEFPIFLY